MRLARVALIAATLFIFQAVAHANDLLRFSNTLGVMERAASGLNQLTSDQVAVIDALVRRDTGQRGSRTPAAPHAATATTETAATTALAAADTFSQRLTADERRTAGLPGLTKEQVAHLDALVERHQGAKLARTLLAPPVYISRARINPAETKKEREIHGSFSLSYGWGSGGYSEKTGSMLLTFEDPDKGYSIAVGYSESHIKGGSPYIYRDDRGRPTDEFQRDLSIGVSRP